jgi:hypothetical protein
MTADAIASGEAPAALDGGGVAGAPVAGPAGAGAGAEAGSAKS